MFRSHRRSHLLPASFAASSRACALVLVCCLAVSLRARAQSPDQAPPQHACNRVQAYAGPAEAAARHDHRSRPWRSEGRLSARDRHRRHAGRRNPPAGAALRHGGHARPAQRPGLAPALRRGEERRLHRRGLCAGGLLRRLRDSRLSHRSGHRTSRSTA